MNMKTVKYIPTLLLFASMLLLTGCEIRYNGCNISKSSGSRELNNECTYTIDGELTALEISGGVDVVVDTTIAKNQIRVLANTDDFSPLVVKAENGKLFVSHKRNTGDKEYKVYVPAFDYNALALAGGSDLEWNCCNADELALTVSGGADCEIKGKCNTLAVMASGGADCGIKGKCNTLAVVASGGADVDLDELIAGEVSVVASGGADVELHAVRTISLTASGGADVYVDGTPQISEWNVSGAADVHIKK